MTIQQFQMHKSQQNPEPVKSIAYSSQAQHLTSSITKKSNNKLYDNKHLHKNKVPNSKQKGAHTSPQLQSCYEQDKSSQLRSNQSGRLGTTAVFGCKNKEQAGFQVVMNRARSWGNLCGKQSYSPNYQTYNKHSKYLSAIKNEVKCSRFCPFASSYQNLAKFYHNCYINKSNQHKKSNRLINNNHMLYTKNSRKTDNSSSNPQFYCLSHLHKQKQLYKQHPQNKFKCKHNKQKQKVEGKIKKVTKYDINKKYNYVQNNRILNGKDKKIIDYNTKVDLKSHTIQSDVNILSDTSKQVKEAEINCKNNSQVIKQRNSEKVMKKKRKNIVVNKDIYKDSMISLISKNTNQKSIRQMQQKDQKAKKFTNNKQIVNNEGLKIQNVIDLTIQVNKQNYAIQTKIEQKQINNEMICISAQADIPDSKQKAQFHQIIRQKNMQLQIINDQRHKLNQQLQRYRNQCRMLQNQLRQTINTVKLMTTQIQAANINRFSLNKIQTQQSRSQINTQSITSIGNTITSNNIKINQGNTRQNYQIRVLEAPINPKLNIDGKQIIKQVHCNYTHTVNNTNTTSLSTICRAQMFNNNVKNTLANQISQSKCEGHDLAATVENRQIKPIININTVNTYTPIYKQPIQVEQLQINSDFSSKNSDRGHNYIPATSIQNPQTRRIVHRVIPTIISSNAPRIIRIGVGRASNVCNNACLADCKCTNRYTGVPAPAQQ